MSLERHGQRYNYPTNQSYINRARTLYNLVRSNPRGAYQLARFFYPQQTNAATVAGAAVGVKGLTSLKRGFDYALGRSSKRLKYGPSKKLPRLPGQKNKMAYGNSHPSNNSATLVKRSRRSRRRRSRRRPLSRKMRKSVKRIAKSAAWQQYHSKQLVMRQITSAVNKVGWNCFHEVSRSAADTLCDDFTVLNDSSVKYKPNLTQAADATPVYLNKKFLIQRTDVNHYKNNTNFPAEVCVYVVKCTDYTSQGPLSELEELYKSQYSNDQVTDYRDDFDQYWSIKGVGGSRKWKIHKKYSFELQGGQETKLSLKMPAFHYNPDAVVQQGVASTDFIKGSYGIVMRVCGKPSHDTATKTNLGISNTQIEYLESSRVTCKVKESILSAKPTFVGANTSFAAITAVIADPEAVGVGTLSN